MRIRRLDHADCDPLAALARRSYAAAFGHSLDPTDLAAMLGALTPASFSAEMACFTLLGAIESGLAGFVQIGPASPTILKEAGIAETATAMELKRLYVDPSMQKRGIGSALLDEALRLAAGKPVLLDVWERNTHARGLYTSRGFVTVGASYPMMASGPAAECDLVLLRRAKAHA